jgi:hypothetical protein
MIVRVFEAELVRGSEAAFTAAMRDDIAEAQRQPGLLSQRWGRRMEVGETHVIVVTEGRELDAIRAWLGAGYLQPKYAPGEASLVSEARVRHFEGPEP